MNYKRQFASGMFALLMAFSPLRAQVTAPPAPASAPAAAPAAAAVSAPVSAPAPAPAKIEPRLIIVGESVVREQWSHTTKIVNAPHNVTLLNPGQCVRLAVYAAGDKRDDYLQNTHVSFTVDFADQKQTHSDISLSDIKAIKPTAADFAATALASARNKPQSRFSMGASRLNWCVPADAADGTATIEADIYPPDGHLGLKATPIHIQSFQTGSKAQFKTNKEFDDFLPTYYRQPNPARLLPVLQYMVAEQTAHPHAEFQANVSAFLIAALKANQLAAEDFQMRLATQPPAVRAVGFNILRTAGHFIDAQVSSWSEEEQKKFQSLPPLADAFDLNPTKDLPGHLDMLWATFWATGQLDPVQAVVSELGWQSDYIALDKLKKSATQQPAPPLVLIRGQSYQAAGRSLVAFQRNNPLVADYIDYLFASSDTAAEIKAALGGLATNSVFKQPLPPSQTKTPTPAAQQQTPAPKPAPKQQTPAPSAAPAKTPAPAQQPAPPAAK